MAAVVKEGFVEEILSLMTKPPSSSFSSSIVIVLIMVATFCISFFLGLLVGWSWKPTWVCFSFSSFPFFNQHPSSPSPPQLNNNNNIKGSASSTSSSNPFIVHNPSIASCIVDNKGDELLLLHSADNPSSSSLPTKKEDDLAVNDEDFNHLSHLVERKDGGLPWKHLMDRSTPNMSYQAWMREPETGPPQYCSRTVYEDATPEMLRDFYWDDEFRLKWDDMIIHATTLEECPTSGTMIVHWIRKFPFFCSDREYTIGRRIWKSGRTYYCVTKGVPCASVPRQQKPRRVDLYYSSWFIRAVESRKGNGQCTACEVMLFHHEDMGIPWEIAKFGVRQGMWGAVKKIECGFRAYQKERASGSPLSRSAFMAQINTKIDPDHLESLENDEDLSDTAVIGSSEKREGLNIPRLIMIGGAVALACSLDRGLLTKAAIFGVARRFGNIGRGAFPRTQL